MIHRSSAWPAGLALTALVLGACCGLTPTTHGAEGVRIEELPDRLRVEIDGQLFTEYRYRNTSRPCLYPVLGPDGVALSRRWPLEPGENEAEDHPHHRSLWFAHGDVNGHDFWSESAKAGTTVHQKFLAVTSGQDTGVIHTQNQLVAKDGTTVGSVEFVLRIHRHPEVRLLDFDVVLHASAGELKLGDTKEGTLAIRLAETLRLAPNKFNTGKPTGHIVNSEGVRDGDTWGKRATWVDYFGPVQGRTMGVALFDHPANPQHPTWWHVRDYGLFAANPFGVHDFEKKPAGTGDYVIPAGQRRTYRYRFVFHRGDTQQARIADLYRDYARQP